jgi:hypothetical protein
MRQFVVFVAAMVVTLIVFKPAEIRASSESIQSAISQSVSA